MIRRPPTLINLKQADLNELKAILSERQATAKGESNRGAGGTTPTPTKEERRLVLNRGDQHPGMSIEEVNRNTSILTRLIQQGEERRLEREARIGVQH